MNILGETLSPSSIRTYLDCGAKYYYKYALELPDPPGANMVRGRIVHRMAEEYYRSTLAGARPDVDDMQDCYESIWEESTADAVFEAGDDIDGLKAQAAVLSRKYLEEVAPEIQPAAMELPVSGEIGGVRIHGVVDLLDTQGRIIDLKAPKRTPSGVDASYAFQMATYAQLTPGATGEVRVDYVIPNKSPKLVTIGYKVSEADRRLTETLYPRVQQAIQEGRFLPNRNSTLCSRKGCNFWRECTEQWGGEVKGAEE